MTGRLADRPVTPPECSSSGRESTAKPIRYVVERAGTGEARLVRIHNPAGKARTFTFDHGGPNVAVVDDEPSERED